MAGLTPKTLSRRMLLAAGAGSLLGGCSVAARRPGDPLRDAPPVSLPRSHQVDMRDAATGHVRRIFVQVPEQPAPNGGHPTLYVLDANAVFVMAAQIARNMGNRPPGLRPDPLMIVGIGYPTESSMDQQARKRDYTPPPATEPGTGGAEEFLDFIQKQLQPALRAAWPTDASRQTLFGHSLGGLLAVHALATRTRMFTRYAAASPSLWWNGGRTLQTVEGWLARAPAEAADRPQVQLRVGALERAARSHDPQRAAKASERLMNEHAETLAARLSAGRIPVDFKEFPGLDHGGVIMPALTDAILFAAQRSAM